MSDNVVKFRRIEKEPEKKPPRKRPEMPGWLAWIGLIVVAIAIYAVQQSGLLGGQ